ncbi:MAG: hypothetical protein ABW087_20900 [Candidatus Thiodiazotropha sp.]
MYKFFSDIHVGDVIWDKKKDIRHPQLVVAKDNENLTVHGMSSHISSCYQIRLYIYPKDKKGKPNWVNTVSYLCKSSEFRKDEILLPRYYVESHYVGDGEPIYLGEPFMGAASPGYRVDSYDTYHEYQYNVVGIVRPRKMAEILISTCRS